MTFTKKNKDVVKKVKKDAEIKYLKVSLRGFSKYYMGNDFAKN
jgi:hypothetical protein